MINPQMRSNKCLEKFKEGLESKDGMVHITEGDSGSDKNTGNSSEKSFTPSVCSEQEVHTDTNNTQESMNKYLKNEIEDKENISSNTIYS
mmetsp:Transcript_14845/g.14424  ORF Transcript_14845/g.14424 Transcript_14845/m.14424 type:complete len:90 (-) Transcript_14845:208-477(-)